jgi:hypothetical protein
MEPKHTQIVDGIPTKIKEAFTYQPEKQRFLWYTGKIKQDSWEKASSYETDDTLIYSEVTISVRMGKNLYPMVTSKKGFFFDKKKKKLTMWYRTKPDELKHIRTLLADVLKKEWLVNEGFLRKTNIPKYTEKNQNWLTKGLLEKVLANKITNPKQACEFIIRYNRMKGLPPETLRKLIKDSPFEYGSAKGTILYLFETLPDPSKLSLAIGLYKESHNYKDTIKQAKALGRKVDPTWSDNRIDEVHKEWTKELMALEVDMMDEEIVNYQSIPELPKGFELISSKKRLFTEGRLMSHCVYTNYWNSVQDKRYIVLHVTDEDGNEATAGLEITKKFTRVPQEDSSYTIRIDQVKARFNREPTAKIDHMVEDLISDQSFIKWCQKERVHSIEEQEFSF